MSGVNRPIMLIPEYRYTQIGDRKKDWRKIKVLVLNLPSVCICLQTLMPIVHVSVVIVLNIRRHPE